MSKTINLKTIERELSVRLGRDGGNLVISGQDYEVELAQDLIVQLRDLLDQRRSSFQGRL